MNWEKIIQISNYSAFGPLEPALCWFARFSSSEGWPDALHNISPIAHSAVGINWTFTGLSPPQSGDACASKRPMTYGALLSVKLPDDKFFFKKIETWFAYLRQRYSNEPPIAEWWKANNFEMKYLATFWMTSRFAYDTMTPGPINGGHWPFMWPDWFDCSSQQFHRSAD